MSRDPDESPVYMQGGRRRAGEVVDPAAMTVGPVEELTIFDFTLPESTESWRPVDDVVMGGVSGSRLVHIPDGHAVFSGTLSRENNGGFASVRCAPGQFALGDFNGIRLRVRGDGRIYRLRLRMDEGFDGLAYQASFPTEDGAWSTIDIPFTVFRPSFRGRDVPNAPALDSGSIRQIGLMIADGQEGAFRLEIALIAAIQYSPGIPRVDGNR